MRRLALASSLALAMASTPALATTYFLNLPVGGSGSVVGSVTTNGAVGQIQASDITAWNLTITGAGSVSTVLTNLNSGVYSSGSSILASPTTLSFDFDNPSPSYLLFQSSFSSGSQYACAASTPFSSTPCYQGLSAVPLSYSDASAQYTGQGAGSSLSGTVVLGAVPEPSTWALMIAGFVVVGAGLRRRARQTATIRFA